MLSDLSISTVMISSSISSGGVTMSNTSPSILLSCEDGSAVFNSEEHSEETDIISHSTNNSMVNEIHQTEQTKEEKIERNDFIYLELGGYEWKHLFLISCSHGDLLLFKQLIHVLDKRFESEKLDDSNFFDINVRDERRATALHKSCAYGHIAITRELLLRTDVDRFCVDTSLATPFHYAAASGNVLVVNLLYTYARESLDSRDVFGNTPLLLAMQNGKLEAVRFLLSVLPTNSVRTKKSTNSRSLLHLAAANYDIDGMKLLLLEKSEFVKERNKRNQERDEVDQSDHDLDELMYRGCLQDMIVPSLETQEGTHSENSQELRLSAHGKVLIQAKEENGLTPLMLAIKEYRSMISKTSAEKQMVLMYLLVAEISSQQNSTSHIPLDSMKRTALHIAAVHDCADFFRIVALLYNAETYLDLLQFKDNNGFTPLHLACKQGSINVVDTIILMCTKPIPPKEKTKILSPPSPLPSFTSLSSSTVSSPISIKQPRRDSGSSSTLFISSPPSSPSLNTSTMNMIQHLTPNTQEALKVLNASDTKNRPPIFYSALAMAKHCKKEAKELPTHSLGSMNHSSSFTSTNSIHILGVRGDKLTFQKIIYNLISSGLISLNSTTPNSPNSTPSSPSKNSNQNISTISSTFDLLSNETDYFEKFPQHFRLCSPTNNSKSKRNFDDFYSSPLHSPSLVHTRTARSMSGSGFSLRKTFGIFQSSSLAEDIDLRPPTSPNKRH